MESSAPSDVAILQAVVDLREAQPGLGRAKILQHLREARKWTISESKLKKLIAAANLPNPAQPSKPSVFACQPEAYPTKYHSQILNDEIEALKRMGARRKLYLFLARGPGGSRYVVAPNCDQQLLLKEAFEHIAECQVPSTDKGRRYLASTWSLRLIWDSYVAVAGIQGVLKDRWGKKLQVKYGVPWRYMPPAVTELGTGLEAKGSAAAFRERVQRAKRRILKMSESEREHITVDAKGEPLWDHARNGQFWVYIKAPGGCDMSELGLL